MTLRNDAGEASPSPSPTAPARGRYGLVQFRASEEEKLGIVEAARRRGFVDEHGTPVASSYLRALVKADRRSLDAGADATDTATAAPAPTPALTPLATDLLKRLLQQATGAANNLNQLIRDVHLVGLGHSPRVEPTALRTKAVLDAIERDVVAPLAALLGRGSADRRGSPPGTAQAPPPPANPRQSPSPPPVAPVGTQERFRRRTEPSDKSGATSGSRRPFGARNS